MQIKGHEITPIVIKDSHSRRAEQFKNKIIQALKKLGITTDDIDIELERFALRKAPASVEWYFDGNLLYYSYDGGRYIDNLYIVMKVIEAEIAALENDQKTLEEFISAFREDDDVVEQRKHARELLGLPVDCRDLDLINKTYKQLAKAAHPDMDGGSHDRFKELNRAHKILKRELS